MNCYFCGKPRVCRSRLRLSDFPEPLIGRLPMRCLDCGDRFFVWIPQLLLAKWKRLSRHRIDARLQKSAKT